MRIFVFAVCAARGDALLVPGRPHALHGSRRATKSMATASLRMSAAQQELRPASLALEIPRQAADDVLSWASAGGRSALPEDDAATFGYDGLEVRRTTSSMMTRQQTSLGRTSSKDWLHCLSTWPRSYVLERIKNPLAAIVGWSAVVAAWMAASPAAPAKPLGTGLHTLVGGALSLLLVFRTNTAYTRYWEGREIFGRLATGTRDLVDFVGLYRREVGARRADRVSALLKAFPIALQLHLQGFRFSSAAAGAAGGEAPGASSVGEKEVLRLFRRVGGGADGAPIPLETFLGALRDMPDVAAALGVPTDLEEAHALDQLHLLKFDEPRSARAPVTVNELAAYYSPLQLWHALRQAGAANRDAASRASNMPLALCTLLAREIKAVAYAGDDFTTRERLYVLKRVAELRATIAQAERIVQTPVPLHYARHTSRFLSVWCFTLPLCLAPMVPAYVAPPVVGVVSWALLGLREIGLLIENPFRRSLQLTMVTDTLGREIDETVALHRDQGAVCAWN